LISRSCAQNCQSLQSVDSFWILSTLLVMDLVLFLQWSSGNALTRYWYQVGLGLSYSGGLKTSETWDTLPQGQGSRQPWQSIVEKKRVRCGPTEKLKFRQWRTWFGGPALSDLVLCFLCDPQAMGLALAREGRTTNHGVLHCPRSWLLTSLLVHTRLSLSLSLSLSLHQLVFEIGSNFARLAWDLYLPASSSWKPPPCLAEFFIYSWY
jgi:hypothetical protein